MQTISQVCLLAMGALHSAYASAAIIVLDFEGTSNNAQVLNFYSGGNDSKGVAGVDYGIEFSPNALSLRDKDVGGSGNFANEPSSDTVMFFMAGSAILNYKAGFDTGFSFFYSAKYAATVYVYDNLNAQGKLLASIHLLPQFSDNCFGDPTGTYCNWTGVGASFEGLARSVDFGGAVQHTGYDNVTFGSAIPRGMESIAMFQTAAVPLSLPATWSLLLVGIIGLGTVQRCKPNALCQDCDALRG